MINYALEYAKKGWKVFPVKDKVPAIKGWQDEATSDPEKLKKLFSENKHTGIGLATGKLSGFTVVDVDNKNGINGFKTLEAADIVLDVTVCFETPGGDGGMQYLYQYCGEVKNKAAVLGDQSAIDIRNDGGLTILPPSIHQNGKAYKWKEGNTVADVEIAPFPKSLLKAIKEQEKVNKASKTRFILPDKIFNGQRNVTLFRLARSLSALGKSEDEILSTVTTTNQERCEEPLVDNEVSNIVKSACSYDKPSIRISSGGKVERTLSNVVDFFHGDPNLSGLFYVNLFDGCIHYSRTPVWNSEIKAEQRIDYEKDLVFIKHYLSVNHDCEPLIYLIAEAIIIVAHERAVHPVRNYLDSLKWDGKERLKNWLTVVAGVEEDAYTSCVGLKTLVGAVARIYNPGVKFDYMLILEGPQGIGKSSMVTILAGDWYAPVSLTDTDKDTIDTMLGAWIIENEEMTCFSRQDIERVKAFLSRSTDRVRLSYDRRSKDFPRQSIFIGTMNPSGDNDYLRDQTGNRRFWPVVCTCPIDRKWLKENRDQLFAEAVVCYKSGEKLYVDDPAVEKMITAEQEDRRSRDPWVELVANFLHEREEVNGIQIIIDCLGVDISKISKSEQTRVGNIMKELGWIKGPYDKKSHCSGYFKTQLKMDERIKKGYTKHL